MRSFLHAPNAVFAPYHVCAALRSVLFAMQAACGHLKRLARTKRATTVPAHAALVTCDNQATGVEGMDVQLGG